jgi:hypothetical protein
VIKHRRCFHSASLLALAAFQFGCSPAQHSENQTVAAGGNYLLNNGPMGNGALDQVTSANYLTNGVAAEFVQEGDALTFTLPVEPLDEYDTAIKVSIGNK